MGPNGLQGIIGITGNTGNTGSKGITGDKGQSGDLGNTGRQGNTGNTGPTGITGATGITSPIGNTGLVGFTGLIGIIGNTGLRGVTGATGLTGSTGRQGANGIQVAIGIIGNTGATGLTRIGATGRQGATGPRGAAGVTGAPFIGIGPIGAINNMIPILLDDAFLVNAGFTGSFNVLANDTIIAGLSGINAGSSLNVIEGRFLNNTVNPLNFIPAPRLLTAGTFNYYVNDKTNVIRSGFAKLSVRSTYLDNPIVYSSNGSQNLFRLNCASGSSIVVETLGTNIGNLSASVPDSLLYFTATGSPQVQVFDPINNNIFNLFNVNTLFGIPQVAGLGFDNKRFLLYTMPISGNRIVQVGVYPYDRYGNPGVQTFSAIQKTPTFSVTVNGINDIAVEKVTGFLFITLRTTPIGGSHIIKYDFVNNIQLAIADISLIVDIGHVAFGSDNILYISSNNGQIIQVNTITLALGPGVSTSRANLGGDLSEPLYFL